MPIYDPFLQKVASNESFLELLNDLDPRFFKEEIIKYIKEMGLSNYERKLLEVITGRIATVQIRNLKRRNSFSKYKIISRE